MDKSLKVVVLLPIKMNNQRVLGKNIKKFDDGTPLMELIQHACLASKKSMIFTYIAAMKMLNSILYPELNI